MDLVGLQPVITAKRHLNASPHPTAEWENLPFPSPPYHNLCRGTVNPRNSRSTGSLQLFAVLTPSLPLRCLYFCLYLCSNNAVHYTLRDCMVVRSCASIAAGEEVTISYLANHRECNVTLAPLAFRRAMLARTTLDGRGFTCNCNRWVNSRLQQHLVAVAATAFLLEVTAGMNFHRCCVCNHNHRLAHTRDGETHACHTAYVTLLVFELLPPCGKCRQHCIEYTHSPLLLSRPHLSWHPCLPGTHMAFHA